MRFREVRWSDSKRWEAVRRLPDGKTLVYVADKSGGLQPTTSTDTWMCEPVKEVFRNRKEVMVLVRLIFKTALVYGREQIFTFYNGNPNNGLPFWKHVEKLSENTRVLYVPLREGIQPNAHSPRWLVREALVRTCRDSGHFQVIAVELVKQMPENFSSKERRNIQKREKTEHVQKQREVSKW